MTAFDTAKTLLDRLPVAVRDALLIFLGSLLTAAAGAAAGVEVPGNALATAVLASAATTAVGTASLWFTRLTKQYGVGSGE